MTRINTVPPSMLSNAHLMAEYRELPRIFTAVLKLQAEGKTPQDVDIPPTYRLGAGHVKFFYDKCRWLALRYEELYLELIARSFKLDGEIYGGVFKSTMQIRGEWWGNWGPTVEDHYLNFSRLAKRSKMDSVLAELESNN